MCGHVRKWTLELLMISVDFTDIDWQFWLQEYIVWSPYLLMGRSWQYAGVYVMLGIKLAHMKCVIYFFKLLFPCHMYSFMFPLSAHMKKYNSWNVFLLSIYHDSSHLIHSEYIIVTFLGLVVWLKFSTFYSSSVFRKHFWKSSENYMRCQRPNPSPLHEDRGPTNCTIDIPGFLSLIFFTSLINIIA